MMDEKFVAEMKNVLIAQRNKILDALAEKDNDFEKLLTTVESGDVVDIASDVVDRTLLDSLSAQDAERLQMINQSLDRISRGTYGHCLMCHKEIPEKRLRALPSACFCIDCQTKSELQNR
ncbi:TraR/DksA family transcriptional regulator [Treponema parvum]|nr:TraR/DksA family transcriptional regulator [Treponema parvum]